MLRRSIDHKLQDYTGLLYDDFAVGDVYEHAPGRPVTETDNLWITLLSMNHHPAHIDPVHAKTTEFGRVLVNSAVTFLFINGLTVNSMSRNCVANLGWDEVRFVKPVFVGDTLFAESSVLSKRLSKTRPNQGIVNILTTGKNQEREIVMTCKRTFLIPTGSAFS